MVKLLLTKQTQLIRQGNPSILSHLRHVPLVCFLLRSRLNRYALRLTRQLQSCVGHFTSSPTSDNAVYERYSVIECFIDRVFC